MNFKQFKNTFNFSKVDDFEYSQYATSGIGTNLRNTISETIEKNYLKFNIDHTIFYWATTNNSEKNNYGQKTYQIKIKDLLLRNSTNILSFNFGMNNYILGGVSTTAENGQTYADCTISLTDGINTTILAQNKLNGKAANSGSGSKLGSNNCYGNFLLKNTDGDINIKRDIVNDSHITAGHAEWYSTQNIIANDVTETFDLNNLYLRYNCISFYNNKYGSVGVDGRGSVKSRNFFEMPRAINNIGYIE